MFITLYLRSSFFSLFLHGTAVLAVFLCCRPIVSSPEASTILPADYLLVTVVNVLSENFEEKTISSLPKAKSKTPVAVPYIPKKQISQDVEGASKTSLRNISHRQRKIKRSQDTAKEGELTSTADNPISQKKISTEGVPETHADSAETNEPVAETQEDTVIRTAGKQTSAANREAVGEIGGGAVNTAKNANAAYLQLNYDYIRRIITRNLSFPASARKKRLSGKIEVSFFIGKDGRVDDIRLNSSSGHALLDMNVVSAIRRSSPFPAPPDRARITLPIVFRLK